jgi:hypothetical protein
MNIVRGVAELNQGLQQLLENRDCSLVSARHLATEMEALRVEKRFTIRMPTLPSLSRIFITLLSMEPPSFYSPTIRF